MPENYRIKRRVGKPRKCKSLNEWMRAITLLDQDVFEKSVTMSSSLNTLRKAKERLQKSIQKVIRYEEEVRKHTKIFKEDTEELRETAQDISNLYKFEEQEQTLLNLHTTLAIQDTSVAQKQINQVEDELDNLSPIIRDPASANPNASARCYDEIYIPPLSTSKISHSLTKSKPVHTCSICMENEVDCVIVECGHGCMCQTCTPELIQKMENIHCPICRANFKEIIVPVSM